MSAETSPREPRFPFGPDDLLQRVPELTVELRSDGSAFFPEHGYQYGPHALRVIEAFSTPVTFREAMAALQSQVRGVQDWADLGTTIRGLFSVGILDRVDGTPRKASEGVGFDAPMQHIAMLNDRERTEAYLKAIPDVVMSGDVVVEIGTGSGVLAMAAARAGARHVYAIEAGSIGRAARSVFEANGLADRITLLPGQSSRVELPERADVLISEIIGNEPLQERVLESTQDAILRFLVPEARFIPRWLRVYAVPVGIPAAVVEGHCFTAATSAKWQDWYGMDFAPLDRANAPSSLRIFLRPSTPRDWVRASEPALLADIDLASGHPALVESEARVVADRREVVNGIVTWFDLGLSPSVELSTDPSRVETDSSWRLPVWILSNPLPVEPGDSLTLRYTYPAPPSRRVTISR